MICIYHSRDLDGWMSAAIVKLWNPKVELVGWDYGKPIPDLTFKQVIMVDVSFPPNIMKENAHRITWIDHHLSAILDWQSIEMIDIENKLPKLEGLRNEKFAACELTWQYFFPDEPMPEIVRLLGRYDCFGHKGTDEERKVLEFQYGARAEICDVTDAFEYLQLSMRTVNSKKSSYTIEDNILVSGQGIYKYLCTEAKQIYSRRFTAKYGEFSLGCVNQERFNPVNFDINYHYEGYNAFVCFWFSKGKWNFSLYNDDGKVDVSVIAKVMGGGGHKGASGFVADDLSFLFNNITNT